MTSKLIVALAALAIVAFASFAQATTDVTGVRWGRDFHLLGHDGKPHELADFRGKVVALYFGYTRCPDVCPIAMAALGQALQLLGSDGKRVQGLFVTVDPQHDKPAVLARYVGSFNPSFIGLYGDAQATQRTTREFKVESGRHHSTPVFLFDTGGRLRLILQPNATPQSIAREMRLLLDDGVDSLALD